MGKILPKEVTPSYWLNKLMPETPQPQAPPDTGAAEAAAKAEADAANKKRRIAISQKGYQSTLKTGGLGVTGPADIGKKTLLGG